MSTVLMILWCAISGHLWFRLSARFGLWPPLAGAAVLLAVGLALVSAFDVFAMSRVEEAMFAIGAALSAGAIIGAAAALLARRGGRSRQ